MELRKVTFKNIDAIIGLSVREDQKKFVAPNMLSLAEAYVAVSGGFWAQPFGICEDDEPVGFVMFGFRENGQMCGGEVVAAREL